MYFYYTNLTPSGYSVGNCVKRAIAMASGMDYRTVEYELNEYRKISGGKTYKAYKNCEGYVLTNLCAKKIEVIKGTTVEEFCDAHPKGRYVLDLSEHWSSCINGDLYDTWDCGKETVNHAYDLTHRYHINVGNFGLHKLPDGNVEVSIWKKYVEHLTKIMPPEKAEVYKECLLDLGYDMC